MAKKTFRTIESKPSNKAAESYISRKHPRTEEQKRKRYNLLIRQSLYDDLNKVATMQLISCNEAICRAIAVYIADHQKLVTRYDEVFKEIEE